MMKNPNPKKTSNKWLQLINIPIQMGMVIFLFSYAGKWLDNQFINEYNFFLKSFIVVGVIIAFINLNRQLKKINESEK